MNRTQFYRNQYKLFFDMLEQIRIFCRTTFSKYLDIWCNRKTAISYIYPHFCFLFTDKVYICGGFNGQECLSSAESYDPATNQWTLLSHMRNRRSGVGVVAHDGNLYALGGFNGITRMNNGERWCEKSNNWQTLSEMYSPRSNFAIEVTQFSSI